jgi:hypothetical protein
MAARAVASSSGMKSNRPRSSAPADIPGDKSARPREMTHDLDLLKVDVDTIAIVIRLRGASVSADMQVEDTAESDPEPGGT